MRANVIIELYKSNNVISKVAYQRLKITEILTSTNYVPSKAPWAKRSGWLGSDPDLLEILRPQREWLFKFTC